MQHPTLGEKKALLYVIHDHLDNPKLKVAVLAKNLFQSERSLFRFVNIGFNMSPNHLIREIRLRRARHLIRSGQVATVEEAASQVGYQHTGYFSNLYKKRFGSRPYQDIRFGLNAMNNNLPSPIASKSDWQKCA